MKIISIALTILDILTTGLMVTATTVDSFNWHMNFQTVRPILIFVGIVNYLYMFYLTYTMKNPLWFAFLFVLCPVIEPQPEGWVAFLSISFMPILAILINMGILVKKK